MTPNYWCLILDFWLPTRSGNGIVNTQVCRKNTNRFPTLPVCHTVLYCTVPMPWRFTAWQSHLNLVQYNSELVYEPLRTLELGQKNIHNLNHGWSVWSNGSYTIVNISSNPCATSRKMSDQTCYPEVIFGFLQDKKKICMLHLHFKNCLGSTKLLVSITIYIYKF
jgi:hypothetical protein